MIILSSEQHPLKVYSEIKRYGVEGREVDVVKVVKSIQNNILVVANTSLLQILLGGRTFLGAKETSYFY